MRVRVLAPFAVAGGLLALPGAASAATLLAGDVSADEAVERSCIARPLSGRGLAVRTVTVPAASWVTARLEGSAPGDWDLALFDRRGRRVAGSAYSGSREVATGLAGKGERLTVQACRRDGGGRSARLVVGSSAIDTGGKARKASLVRVSTPTRARKEQLTRLGVELTEHGGKGFVGAILHGPADAAKLRKANFAYTVEVADLAAQSARDRQADRAYAQSVRASSLPSGRDTYRYLEDYSEEMKALAEDNPDLVKPIVLPLASGEGRPVEGLEITTNPQARDGKPVFLQMGLHHAREWPSGEHALEWAYELVNGYRAGNARVKSLVESVRTIVVPVVNPDGFNTSRVAGATSDPLTGRGAPNPGEGNETVNIVSHPFEYRRKNCRLPNSDSYSCAGPSLGLASTGVDPNRNYGGLWGGPGASADPMNETYRGPGPFSEPETRNIQDLVSKRQVTTLITNHTFSNLVLRPPGVAAQGDAPDEAALRALGGRMAAENGYSNIHGFELYDTTGTTEDWSYGATGGYGYTFEIGCVVKEGNDCQVGHFHPPYAEMVKEYEGETEFSDAGGRDGKGNREAYFLAMENARDTKQHSVLAGKAPAGAVLRLKKTFQTETSPVLDEDGREGDVQTFTDTLDTVLDVPGSGRFEWHLNPSTRPAVAQDRGDPNSGTPSDPVQFSGDATGAAPCADAESNDDSCVNDHVFTVPDDPTKDNDRALVRIEWLTPGSDWDMRVFRADENGQPVGDQLGASQQGTTDFEQTTVTPLPPGDYVVRVNNWAAAEPYTGTVTFQPKPPFRPAQVESWTLTCESPEGTVLDTRQVTIARGQRQSLDLSKCGKPKGGGKKR